MRLLRYFVIGFLASGVTAHAYDYTGKLGVGINAGLPTVVAPSQLEEPSSTGFNLGAWGRYHLTAPLGVELAYDYFDIGRVDTTVHGPSLSAFWRTHPYDRLSGILQAGVGWAFVDDYPFAASYSTLMGKGRVGLEFQVAPCTSLGAHVDYAYLAELSDTRREAHIVTPGVSLTFYMDRMDDDESRGRGTAGAAVGPTERTVHFETGSAEITPEASAKLDRAAEAARLRKQGAVVEGHADSTGSDDLNDRLSRERAEAVVDAMEQRGVPERRMEAKAYGEDRPVEPNDTAEGRRANRRVKVKVNE